MNLPPAPRALRSGLLASLAVLVAAACGGQAAPGAAATSAASAGAGGAHATTAAVTTGGGSASTTSSTGRGGGAATVTSASVTSVATGTGGQAVTSSAGGAGGSAQGGAGGAPWGGPLTSLEELDLGDVPLFTSQAVPVPPNTLGFTVLAGAPSLAKVIGFGQLTPPSGNNVITMYANTGHTAQLYVNHGWVAAADPQSDSADAYPVQPGAWSLFLGDDDNSIPSAHVTVWARRTADGQFHGGVVDMNVFIVAGVSDPGSIFAVLTKMFAGQYAGLDLGALAYFPLDPAFTTIDSLAKYRTMVAGTLGVGAPHAMNLFVVGGFSGADFPQGVIGAAAGIPGSPMLGGTTLSGLAYAPTGNADLDASILRHETGHLAGLFHTTEFHIMETDPISDTPECPFATITGNPQSCPDVGNMMFPIAYGATTISTGQSHVLQGSALYRGILTPGGMPEPPPAPAPPPAPFPPLAVRHLERPLPSGADPLLRLLASVWCGHDGADPEGLAVRLAGSPARLRALALDDALPGAVRARALGAYVRAAAAGERAPALDLADRLAADEASATELRAAALAALERADLPRARRAAAPLRASTDVVIRSHANRLAPP